MNIFQIVNESQLDSWVRGNPAEAQGKIVELVWRLVCVSCPRPKYRRFPLSDSIGQHGPDGKLETAVGFEPFIPEGKSIWEIGTSVDARAKANKDYNDSTDDIPDDERRETTFIFVTPLSGRRDWKDTWKPEGGGVPAADSAPAEPAKKSDKKAVDSTEEVSAEDLPF